MESTKDVRLGEWLFNSLRWKWQRVERVEQLNGVTLRMEDGEWYEKGYLHRTPPPIPPKPKQMVKKEQVVYVNLWRNSRGNMAVISHLTSELSDGDAVDDLGGAWKLLGRDEVHIPYEEEE